MKKNLLTLLVLVLISSSTFAADTLKVKMTTTMGTMVLRLYNETPQHRDNFVKLVNEHFYDSLLFHRIIANFMIQGGDPNSKHAAPGAGLGNGGDNMARIPAEFNPALIHKKGVLAAARDGNPQKASSACQFYIVQGKTWSEGELNNMPNHYTAEQKKIYATIGGTPHLDMGYTVFGEVIEGLDVLDKIAAVKTGAADRPKEDVRILKMEMVSSIVFTVSIAEKLSKKGIQKASVSPSVNSTTQKAELKTDFTFNKNFKKKIKIKLKDEKGVVYATSSAVVKGNAGETISVVFVFDKIKEWKNKSTIVVE